ncbi:hypothetical protein [Endozoicomonas numazuensis]|uniref:DUF2971 domain-containing protein n=1 Tax=Endozoicomonas numazuensis TaxID=1137799 RepID=A0A081NFH4_9GAMM|nr:hypothetical protein [Endozoicomonas numazuensis]KEQ17197.1 hypothetical protein GZ78_15260 [Endozoicomonas numazuensis]
MVQVRSLRSPDAACGGAAEAGVRFLEIIEYKMDFIYRFMSLVELCTILHDSNIKFTQLMLMDDPNEGLGNVLSAQESFSYSWELQKHNKIKEHHERIQAISYISCWTKEPDLMAMWLLYSKNKDSIRIKTTEKKLKNAVNKFGKNHYFLNQLDAPKGSITLLSYPDTDNVKYVSFEELSSEIKKKHDRYVKECVKSIDKDLSKDEKEIYEKNIKEIEDDRIIEIGKSSFLKDKCFRHERELRACFRVYYRNDLLEEEWRKPEHKSKLDYFFGGALIYEPAIQDLPKTVEIPINHDFIESICFDPRTPAYIKDGMLKIIRLVKPDITVEESYAFGYKLDNHDFSLREEL